MEIPCALKKHLEYVSNPHKCGSCSGLPTVRCYVTKHELEEQREFYYQMFLREFEKDGGAMEELLATARGELELW